MKESSKSGLVFRRGVGSWMNFALHSRADFVLRHIKVVSHLEIHPKIWRSAEIAAEP
jgi:hypothetical protein